MKPRRGESHLFGVGVLGLVQQKCPFPTQVSMNQWKCVIMHSLHTIIDLNLSLSLSLCRCLDFVTVSWFIHTFFYWSWILQDFGTCWFKCDLELQAVAMKGCNQRSLEGRGALKWLEGWAWLPFQTLEGTTDFRVFSGNRLIFRWWVRNGKKHAKNSECVGWCWWCSSELRKWDVELWWITKKAIFPTPCPMKHRSVRNKSRLSCCASDHTAFWTLVGRHELTKSWSFL